MRRTVFVAGSGAFAAFVAFFGFLALDLAWRVWDTRAGFDSPSAVGLIIGLECARGIATILVAVCAVRIAARREPGHGALALALLCAALWYAKATTYGFPGYVQERLAVALVDAGVSRTVLLWVFGKPLWSLAPAATAFLLFALRYPEAPDAGRVRSVHATGRRGMLRDVALAGTDVRSLLHRAAAFTLDSGVLRTPLVIGAGAGATVLIAIGGPAARAVAWAWLAVAVLLSIAFLRTAFVVHTGEPKRRLRALARAAAVASAGLCAGGLVGFLPGAALARIALVLSSTAPVLAAALLLSIAALPGPATGPA